MKRKIVLGMFAVAFCLAGCKEGQDTGVKPTASLREEITLAPESTTPVPENKTEQEEMTAKPTKRPEGAGI